LPFALHDAALADLAPGHSLVERLLASLPRGVEVGDDAVSGTIV
jgi:hypothetical protein